MKPDPVSRVNVSYTIGIAFLSIYSFFIFAYAIKGGLENAPDQKSFYKTSSMLIQGQNPYKLSNTYIKNTQEITFAGLENAGGNTLYPPSSHILFIPFYAFLSSPEAGTKAWLWGNIIFIAIIFFSINRQHLSQSPFLHKYLFLIIILGSYATKSCLRYGQTSLLCFAFLMAALLIKDRNKILGGVFFALALAKPSLAILFIWYLLIRRQFTVVFTGIIIHVLLIMAVASRLDISTLELVADYFEKIHLLTANKTALWLYYQVNGVSLKSIFYILDFPQTAVVSITAVFYASAALLMYAKRNSSDLYLLGITALMTIFIDYHWHYDFVVLFLLFPVFAQELQNGTTKPVALVYFILVLFMPDLLRAGATGTMLAQSTKYLLVWQIAYTLMFIFLALLFMAKTSAQKKEGRRTTFRSP